MGDTGHPAGTATHCPTHARSCLPSIWVLWCLLCFQREIYKHFRCSHTAMCVPARVSRAGGRTAHTVLKAAWRLPAQHYCCAGFCPAAPSPHPGLGSASSSESIHIHSCRMEQLGGTSRLRFFQAPAASISADRRAAGCSEGRELELPSTAGTKHLAAACTWLEGAPHPTRTPPCTPGRRVGTHSWWALQL